MLSRTEMKLLADMIADRVMHQADEILTGKQCAEMLGISPAALRQRCARGHIPYHKKKGNVYFSKREVTEFYLDDESAITSR